MKTNYDANNGETIQGQSVRSVLYAARERYGNQYIVRNTQTYQNPYWIAEYSVTKGNAGINDDTMSISVGADFI